MTQKGFIFDTNKCTGCAACQIACVIENELDPGMTWRQVTTFNPARYEEIPLFHHSLSCNHCLDPPCVACCPALALSKDSLTGAVTIDSGKCIGCSYCAWACPYDALRFNNGAGVMEKCTFCDHRIAEGLEPACVTLCPTGALRYGDVDISQLDRPVMGFPKARARPAIEFVPLKKDRICPEASEPSSAWEKKGLLGGGRPRREPSKIRLGREWTLVAFTLLAAWLFGYLGASITSRLSIAPWGFVTVGIGGMVVGILHLGKRSRARRAVSNWRSSWLSREIILFSLFWLLGSVFVLLSPSNRVLGWVAVVMGFASLVAMDNVYAVTATPRLRAHSARVVLTGLFAWSILSGGTLWAIAFGGIKLCLYSARKIRLKGSLRSKTAWWSTVRIGIGLVTPGVVWLFDVESAFVFAGMCAFFGEIVDRCEYYVELYVPTPQHQMAFDLERYKKKGELEGFSSNSPGRGLPHAGRNA